MKPILHLRLGDDPAPYVALMLVLLALFAARVLGQVLAATVRPRWLPPMARWYSGVMPYRYLLPSQLLIIALMIGMIVGVDRGSGLFGDRRWGVGAFAVGASFVYAGGMIWRAVRRTLQPPARRGVVIPIVFHFVLAAFLLVFGSWHLSTTPNLP